MMTNGKLFSIALLAILIALPSTGLSDGRHAEEEGGGEAKKERAAQDSEMTETSISKIDEIFPATKYRGNAEFFKVKKEKNKTFAQALNDSRDTEGELAALVDRERASAQHIALLMSTLGKDNFQEQWQKAKEFAVPFEKPGDTVSQEEALAKRIELAFKFWGEEKGKFTPPGEEDPLYPFYLAFRGDNKALKGSEEKSEKKWAEKLKKEQWDAIKTAGDSSKSEDERAAARKKLLGDPNADINDKSNRISLGKDALKNLSTYPKEVQEMLPKALSQKVGNGWAIAVNGKDGKPAWVEIPKDPAAFKKAFADGALKNWDVVGEPIDENAKKLAWAAGKWAAPQANAATPKPGNGPDAAPAKAVQIAAKTSQPTPNESKPADVSFVGSGRCQECHKTSVAGNALSVTRNGQTKTISDNGFASRGQMSGILSADEKSSLDSFFKGDI